MKIENQILNKIRSNIPWYKKPKIYIIVEFWYWKAIILTKIDKIC